MSSQTTNNEVLLKMLDQLAELNQLIDEQSRQLRNQDQRLRLLQQQLHRQKTNYPAHSRHFR